MEPVSQLMLDRLLEALRCGSRWDFATAERIPVIVERYTRTWAADRYVVRLGATGWGGRTILDDPYAVLEFLIEGLGLWECLRLVDPIAPGC